MVDRGEMLHATLVSSLFDTRRCWDWTLTKFHKQYVQIMKFIILFIAFRGDRVKLSKCANFRHLWNVHQSRESECESVKHTFHQYFTSWSVCDDTKNLNETESETFFPYQKFSDTESNTFFDTKCFPIPNSILFLILNFFNTESDTF